MYCGRIVWGCLWHIKVLYPSHILPTCITQCSINTKLTYHLCCMAPLWYTKSSILNILVCTTYQELGLHEVCGPSSNIALGEHKFLVLDQECHKSAIITFTSLLREWHMDMCVIHASSLQWVCSQYRGLGWEVCGKTSREGRGCMVDVTRGWQTGNGRQGHDPSEGS